MENKKSRVEICKIAEFVCEKYPDSSFAQIYPHISWENKAQKDCSDVIDDLMIFFNQEFLDICSCGQPINTYVMLRELLHIRKDYTLEKINHCEVHERTKNDLCINEDNDMQQGMLQFVMYVLDSYGMVEHGFNINHCWLTELGNKYLTVLDAWYEKEE